MTVVLMSARYTEDERREATQFAEMVLRSDGERLTRAVVLDVGQIAGRGWAVVEANAAWGAGIYGCAPEAALDVIRHATIQPEAAH